MIEIRPCPSCIDGLVEVSHGHDPYRGEIVSVDVCPECDGTREIAVEPIDEDDLPPLGIIGAQPWWLYSCADFPDFTCEQIEAGLTVPAAEEPR